MKRNHIDVLYVLLMVCGTITLSGQTAIDALRYSELLPSGTARNVGVGGAMTSLGGDMGSISVNPASLGVYRQSEFNLSPAMKFTAVGSRLNDGTNQVENAAKFGIENIGLVFYKGYNNKKLKSFNFSATLNRVVNFNRTAAYSGNTPGSIINAFQASAQGLTNTQLDGFTSGIAADAGAIFNAVETEPDVWDSDFFSPGFYDYESLSIDREETITTTGGVSDLGLSLGFNISDKLYLGGSANFILVRFEEIRSYAEDDRVEDVIPFFRNLTYEQNLSTTGLGVGFKGGFIYRVTNEIRLGGSVHTPTNYSLSDDFTTDLNYFYIDESDASLPLVDGEGLSPLLENDYKLRTPWRYNGGVSVVMRKFGFLSLDVEYLDYSNLEYDLTVSVNNAETVALQDEVNAEINNGFSNALNIKLGAEYLIKKFRIRAGYGIYGTPFDDSSPSRKVLSFGAGIRGESAFLDLAFRNTSASENYSPYISSNGFSQQIFNDINTNNLILTFGYRF